MPTEQRIESQTIPEWRGYANLGLGQYAINHSAPGEIPELIISIATEAERSGNRQVGEDRDNPDGYQIQPEAMAVRIRFASVAGLDALEKQLRVLREVHFPGTVPSRNQEIASQERGMSE